MDRVPRWLACCGCVLLASVLAGRAVADADADGDGVPDARDACAGTLPRRQVDAQGCCSAARALRRGREAVLKMEERDFQVGDVWVLRRMLSFGDDPEMRQLADRQVQRLSSDRVARLIDPNARRGSLPVDPGHGAFRLMYYTFAPVSEPEEQAVKFIVDFAASAERGYVLAQQFLVLEWSREAKLPLPNRLRETSARLLERIAAEQKADAQFSDLFAERAALLLVFAPPNRAAADRWIDAIANAQSMDGSWGDTSPVSVTYDGQTTTVTQTHVHTTTLAMLALRAYLAGAAK